MIFLVLFFILLSIFPTALTCMEQTVYTGDRHGVYRATHLRDNQNIKIYAKFDLSLLKPHDLSALDIIIEPAVKKIMGLSYTKIDNSIYYVFHAFNKLTLKEHKSHYSFKFCAKKAPLDECLKEQVLSFPYIAPSEKTFWSETAFCIHVTKIAKIKLYKTDRRCEIEYVKNNFKNILLGTKAQYVFCYKDKEIQTIVEHFQEA